jgi:hypothetical protein
MPVSYRAGASGLAAAPGGDALYGYCALPGWEFPKLDGFIRRRLRAILRKQEKRPGFGKCHADHKRWPNAYFAALGLFTMTEARMSASQSR